MSDTRPALRIRVLTLFPDLIRQVVSTSMVGRARAAGIVEVEAIDIRSFADNAYGKVDDAVFGGGTGMLMMCEPVFRAWEQAQHILGGDAHTVFLSAHGRPFTQARALELAQMDSLVLLCGHYEGIDQRVLDRVVDEEISLGDYVLTGGELPALAVIDAATRLLPGVLPNEEAWRRESHMEGTLEGPQYTRPAVWQEIAVPPVLLSGHHANIEKYRRLSALEFTRKKRPDLFNRLVLSDEEWERLLEFIRLNQSSTPTSSEVDS